MAITLDWAEIATASADRYDGDMVEISGFMAPAEPDDTHSYFLLVAEPVCCIGCWPTDPLAVVEVFAAVPIPAEGRAVRLSGRWCRLVDDPAGWRYQLRDARLIRIEPAEPMLISRRGLLSAGAALGLAACVPIPIVVPVPASASPPPVQGLTADLHSHCRPGDPAAQRGRAAVHPGGGTDAARRHGARLPGRRRRHADHPYREWPYPCLARAGGGRAL